MTNENALFDKLGCAGTMAYIHQNCGGDEALRLLLDLVIRDAEDVITRDSWEADAEELEATGFKQAASIVREYAEDAPDTEANPFPEGTARWRDWNRRELGDFGGFHFDDDERAARVKELRGRA